ncbi:hypothetical protein KORDIASMS9_03386 [Kordia sp. SMS9]|uniref:hypothetical protein n=1 Tax=Kordia sp. SMS9 TaxID=2282170 RepID=UPI000E0DF2F5|nr:hypothetical protein [Kordia sp. SMS9]AXG71131.1 hypothetical protein KORDIASMS9_03386 [Kordia sp. SMS9]
MIPNIIIKIEGYQEVCNFLNRILSQFEYLGNVSNLHKDEPFQDFPEMETILKHYSEFLSASSIILEIFKLQVNRNYTHNINIQHIDFLLSHNSIIKSYKNIPQVVSNLEKEQEQNIFYSIVKEYLYSWFGYSNYRILSASTERNDTIIHSNLLKLSIWNELENLKNSNKLKEILEPLLWSYYYGYFIGNKMLKNLFYAKIRLYINKQKLTNSNLTEEQFIETFRDVEITDDKSNELHIKESYLILVKFLKERIKENSVLHTETDIYLFHSKISGLLRLVRILHSNHTILNENIIFTNFKDFYEEIHCDCNALKKRKENRYLISPPKFSHWILMLSFHPKENINAYQSLLQYSKHRIFLSDRVHKYICNHKKEETSLDIEEIQEIKRNISQKYSDYDDRVIVPLYLLFQYDYTFLTNELYSLEYFSKLCKEKNILVNDDEIKAHYEFMKDIYWSNLATEFKNEELEYFTNLHHKVSATDFVDRIKMSQSLSYSESKLLFKSFMKRYPYCSFAFQELAIIEDQNKKHKEAFGYITKSLVLQPNEKIKWDSFYIILNNILN